MYVKKVVALCLAGIIVVGMIYTHPAFAHNFGGDQSATFIAKTYEIKAEVNQVAKNIGNADSIGYYADALNEYWNANDTKEMGERNSLLAKEIPDTINATLEAAKSGDSASVDSHISDLNGYLAEALQARVDPDKANNSTIQALAVAYVSKEVLEKYGTAINSTVDLTDMSNMNMNNMKNGNNTGGMSSSGSMNGMSMAPQPQAIVDQNAYDNSIALAMSAQQMFSDVASKNPSNTYNSKISDAFTKLISDLNAKADGNTIMMDVHEGIHPGLISGYNVPLESSSTTAGNPNAAVPEFPLPVLLTLISVAGVITITRLKGLR